MADEEVSEQQQQAAAPQQRGSPEDQAQQAAPPQQAQPSGEAEETPEDGSAEQTPPELDELDRIIERLETLHEACSSALAATDALENRDRAQAQLGHYAHHLRLLPEVLQLLNDYRRHLGSLSERAEQARSALVELRGGEDDALSSEEGRVIVAVSSAKETVLATIERLEGVLSNVRAATQPLLAIIGYDGDGFESFASHALSHVRVDLVEKAVREEEQRVRQFRHDLADLFGLEEHARELRG